MCPQLRYLRQTFSKAIHSATWWWRTSQGIVPAPRRLNRMSLLTWRSIMKIFIKRWDKTGNSGVLGNIFCYIEFLVIFLDIMSLWRVPGHDSQQGSSVDFCYIRLICMCPAKYPTLNHANLSIIYTVWSFWTSSHHTCTCKCWTSLSWFFSPHLCSYLNLHVSGKALH